MYCLLAEKVHSYIESRPTSAELRSGKYRAITEHVTVCVATDGNQDRGLAYGARIIGCRCVTYLHANVSQNHKDSKEQLDAVTIRINGEYEESVNRAKEDAVMNGWHSVSSSSWDDFSTGISSIVTNAYLVLIDEALKMIGEVEETTHVLMCTDVGSIAAAVFIGFYLNGQTIHKLRPETTVATPRFVIIEPLEADCLFQSSQMGKLETSAGSLQTIMQPRIDIEDDTASCSSTEITSHGRT